MRRLRETVDRLIGAFTDVGIAGERSAASSSIRVTRQARLRRAERAAGAATAVTSRETLLAPWLPAACRVTIEGAICDQCTMLHTAMKTMARAAKIKGPFERR